MKIFIIGAQPSSLINFRGDFIRKLVSTKKHDVVLMASGASDKEIEIIKDFGGEYRNYPVSRNGLNPVDDLKTLASLCSVFKYNSPDIVFAYTIKPIIWGGIASRLIGRNQFYALITGLGYAFQPGGVKKNFLVRLVTFLYRIALSNSKAVIFQNPDNMREFIDKGIVPPGRCYLVNGSGVDLERFKKSPLSKENNFLLIARLLGDKGIREYFRAAEIVKLKYPCANFYLLGPEDPSPDGIRKEEVLGWQSKGIIVYCGATKDVRPFIKDANIFVLPSYHEGMPRTVLEAMAMGRPILTTDVPGCKETVVNGENGWLIEKASVEQLAERMIWFIENPDQWQEMGDKSYTLAREKFDVHKVNAKILEIIGLDYPQGEEKNNEKVV
ncbi:glycosyltransferase family 4 protein [Shewanella algae]|uniref:glycosyltransferase family 4 protein n=1 Tax=Shewanella algae TaxID=38313 RepID=UPI00313B7DEA